MDLEEVIEGLIRSLNHRPAVPVQSIEELFGGSISIRERGYYEAKRINLGPIAEASLCFPYTPHGKLLFHSVEHHEMLHAGQIISEKGLSNYRKLESFVSWAKNGFMGIGPSSPLKSDLDLLEAGPIGYQYVFLGDPRFHLSLYELYGDEIYREFYELADSQFSSMLERAILFSGRHKESWELIKRRTSYVPMSIGIDWFGQVLVASDVAFISCFSSLGPRDVHIRYISFLNSGGVFEEAPLEHFSIDIDEIVREASSSLDSIGNERSSYISSLLKGGRPSTCGDLLGFLISIAKMLPTVVFDRRGKRRYVLNWNPENYTVLGFYVDLSVAIQVKGLIEGVHMEVKCPLAGSDQFKGAPHNCSNCPGLLHPELQFWDGCPFLRDWERSKVMDYMQP